MPRHSTDLVVLGAGPGGYAAAFMAADHGLSVTLIDADARLGGVCLNRGCIPSKALLHVAKLISETRTSSEHGITFGAPKIDLDQLRKWKTSVIEKLSGGISQLASKHKVTVLQGRGHFESSTSLRVNSEKGQTYVDFKHAIVAVGSRPALPAAFDLGNPRVMTSTEALNLEDIPNELLVIGGGYIGMELGTVYSALGSKVTVVEAGPAILGGADPDLVRPVLKFCEKAFSSVLTSTKVTSMSTSGKSIKVELDNGSETVTRKFDRVLVSVGRVPNSQNLGLENTKVTMDDRGYIQVDSSLQTSDPSIYAIGDIVGGLMLAHKAHKEAKIAVENITGTPTRFENVMIPAVVFTDPEVAWVGMTENEAKQKGIQVKTVKFPWSASGRALTFARPDGLTKLILEPETHRIIGVGIVGVGAGELIAEATLAIEMGATAEDLSNTVHAHPTLSETLMEAAEGL
ncbi:dihydrolipoyl dehydrogenase [bacterium]|nr:dihydrolipoyl dehydrogenase [bacterium]